MSDSEVRWFRSKVDWWIGVILVALPLVELWVLASSVARGDSVGTTSALFGCAVVGAIYSLLLIPTRYGLSSDELIIRFGIVRRRLPLDQIQEVAPSHNPLSSAAMSLDRLAIRIGPGPSTVALISPAEREEFLEMLAGNAGLGFDGPRLVRRQDMRPSSRSA